MPTQRAILRGRLMSTRNSWRVNKTFFPHICGLAALTGVRLSSNKMEISTVKYAFMQQ